MINRSGFFAILACIAVLATQNVSAQDKPVRSEPELREHLIWSSPWQGRSVTPPGLYSYRTVFRQRRDALIAEVTSLSTNQKSDSVVTLREGALSWQDSNGAEVNVTLGATGELVGTARSTDAQLPIVLKAAR